MESVVQAIEVEGYDLFDLVSEGEHASVYRGRRRADDTPVIAKMLPAGHHLAVAAVHYEWDFLKSLSLSGVPKALELCSTADYLAVVLEDCGGVDLATLSAERRLSFDEIFAIAASVADTLEQLHGSGIVHHDIQPSNLVYNSQTGVVQLIDFKRASRLSRDHAEPPDVDTLSGSLNYVSPEQTGRSNRAVDYRTDFYSLGATLYRLITGRTPFTESGVLSLVYHHLAVAPAPMEASRQDVPPTLSAIVKKLMAKAPEDRYQSAFGLAQDLQLAIRDPHSDAFVAGKDDVSARFEIPQRLYGRDDELAQLESAFHRSREGDPTLVLVSGYPGVGKSALVKAFQANLARRGVRSISGKFDQLSNVPFAAVSEAFGELVRDLLTGSETDIQQVREDLAAELGALGAVVMEIMPELELLIGRQAALPTLTPAEASLRQQLAFTVLVRCLSVRGDGIALFLDDLQWADAASIRLLSAVLTDPEISGLCVLGAYRDTEVDAGHPLQVTLDELSRKNVDLVSLTLHPLKQSHVMEFVADTVKRPVVEVGDLAAAVFDKTQGNPFFIGRLLRDLHENSALNFDENSGHWVWSIEQLLKLQIADNVADFLAAKLMTLPETTRRVIHDAACLGHAFQFEDLLVVSGRERRQLAEDLWPALHEEIILPMGEGWRLAGLVGDGGQQVNSGGFRFPHDRVQEAGYLLFPEDVRSTNHLRIGSALLSHKGGEESGVLFEIVNQFNKGRALLDDPAERSKIAGLNATAAKQALSASAFKVALEYASCGIALLGDSGFKHQFDSMYSLHQSAAQAALMVENYDLLKALVEEVRSQISDPRQLAEFTDLEILAHIDLREPGIGIDKALKALESLGMRLPRKPGKPRVMLELLRHRLLMGFRKPEWFLDRPDVSDPDSSAMHKIINHLNFVINIAEPNLFPVIVLRTLQLIAKHGCSPSLQSYQSYALLQSVLFDDQVASKQWDDVAQELAKRPQSKAHAPVCDIVSLNGIQHWSKPLRDLVEPLGHAYFSALEVGQKEWAGIGAVTRIFIECMAGMPLRPIAERAAGLSRAFVDQGTVLHMHDLWYQYALNLLGEGNKDVFAMKGNTGFDEDYLIDKMDYSSLSAFHMVKVFLGNLFDNETVAFDNVIKARDSMGNLLSAPHYPYFLYNESLAYLRWLPERGPQRKRQLKRIRSNLKKLRRWSKINLANFAHRADLIDAELARLSGKDALATEFYEKAIAGAARWQFLPELGLANERAAEFHRDRGRDAVAATRLEAAFEAYAEWGGEVKLQHMRLRYPAIGRLAASRSQAKDVDVEAILSASRAISRDIEVEDLLRSLIVVVAQNVGAQSAKLILATDDELRVVASLSAPEAAPEISRDGLSPAEDSRLPASVVQFVQRSKEKVVVGDVASSRRFAQDPSFSDRSVASLLCAPIMSQSRMLGLIYLEHGEVKDNFSPERLTVLDALSGQMAVSLENARLYADLKQSLEHQMQVAQSQERFIPHQFLVSLNRSSIQEVALGDFVLKELNILFSDIRGFSSIIERMEPKDSIRFINEFFSYMEPAISDAGGFIDSYEGDAIMALFDTDADRAILASLGMMRGLQSFNQARGDRGEDPIRIGVGLNTGEVMLGAVGTPNRLKCGVVGDSVNLAARVESVTKQYDASILISDATMSRLVDPAKYHLRPVERVRVAGRQTPVTLYELFDGDPPEIFAGKAAVLTPFNEAAALYYQGEHEDALRRFYELAAQLPHDRPLQIYIERCRKWIAEGTPDGWDGVERTLEK